MSTQLTVTVADWVYDQIEEMKGSGGKRSELVQKLIINSPEFKDFVREKEDDKDG